MVPISSCSMVNYVSLWVSAVSWCVSECLLSTSLQRYVEKIWEDSKVRSAVLPLPLKHLESQISHRTSGISKCKAKFISVITADCSCWGAHPLLSLSWCTLNCLLLPENRRHISNADLECGYILGLQLIIDQDMVLCGVIGKKKHNRLYLM